jgi:membrane-bound ClpP family serine protease
LILIGVLFVLAEILTARVIFSRIGNIVVLFGSAGLAWHIARAGADGSEPVPHAATTRGNE